MKTRNYFDGFVKFTGLAFLFTIFFTGCPQKPAGTEKEKDEIKIGKVFLASRPCTENTETAVDSEKADLIVEFKESYAGLSVKVNNTPATVKGKTAAAKLTGITEAGIDVTIVAEADGKTAKTFKFKAKKNPALSEEISITSVKLDNKPCTENTEIAIDTEKADLEVTFAESYAGLSVKVNNAPAAVTGNTATARITGITEAGIKVSITAETEGKTKKTFTFTAKKNPAALPGQISITSVIFDGNAVEENGTAVTTKNEADVEVTFAENYAGLSVKVNTENAVLTEKKAVKRITGLTETEMDVVILAEADGKTSKTFKFKAKKVIPIEPATIKELIFEGKNINPAAASSYDRDTKRYSASGDAPLLSEITADGLYKVGDASHFKLKVAAKFDTPDTQEQKIKVQNTDTNTVAESSIASWGKVEAEIKLQKGDNHLVITYSEKDKLPLVYKVIAGYAEPEYNPIEKIVFNDNIWYSTKKQLEDLEAGTQSISLLGVPSIKLKIVIPEIWYEDEGWSLSLDGTNVAKTEFIKSGYSIILYTFENSIPVTLGGTKQIKIVFENTSRNYKKEYKMTVNHVIVHKINDIILINKDNKDYLTSNSSSEYKFDDAKGYYKAETKFSVKDRVNNVIMLVKPQDEEIIPQYAFSNTETELSSITSWTPLTKKTIQYNQWSSQKEITTYTLDNKTLNFGSEFLYVLLEKDGTKTYFVTEVEREKIPEDNSQKENEVLIYQDETGTAITNNSPLAKKGLIRVLPKSPRAKVELVSPEAKNFTLNSADGYYECTIDLTEKETSFSYNIVAENTTDKTKYNGEFVKSVTIKDIRFAYNKETYSWNRNILYEKDGHLYLAFDKKEVKDNKIYLFVDTYKGVEIECSDFLNYEKDLSQYSSDEHTIELDVASLMYGTETTKDFTANLKLSGSPIGTLNLSVFVEDDIIQTLYVANAVCAVLSGNRYFVRKDVTNSYNKKIEVGLYLLKDETPQNTNRKIRILEGGTEKLVEINQQDKTKLEFVHKDFVMTQGQTVTLTIEYYADKTNSAPTKTYTVIVEDI